MADGFYLADEKFAKVDGKSGETQNVLYFKLGKAQFDGRATKEHLKNFPTEYANFKKANPDFKLPWGDDEDFVGVKALEPGEIIATPVTVRLEKEKAEKDADAEKDEKPEDLFDPVVNADTEKGPIPVGEPEKDVPSE